MKALKVKDSLQEGVGDKYAAKFGIPDDTEERKVQGTDEQIISRDGDWKLLKNPRSLDSLGSSVRGVIIPSGDIYIENFSEKIHHDLLKILYEKGILDGVFTKKWGSQLPTESGFLTIQRYKNSDDIAIGESNKLLYNEKEFKKILPHYQKFTEAARKKNPGLNIKDKVVGMKFSGVKESAGNTIAIVKGPHFMS